MLWLAAALALAHPFGNKFAAHKVDIQLADQRVRITYLADVPNALVRTAIRQHAKRDPWQAMLQELETGMLVEVDGTRVDLEVTDAKLIKGSEHTQLLQLTLQAPYSNAPHHLRVSNGNLPEVPAYFANSLLVDATTVVIDSTLVSTHDDGSVRDLSGRWRMGDTFREVEVNTRPESGFERASRLLGPAVEPLRPPGQALVVPMTQLLSRPAPLGGFAALGLLLLGGGLVARRRR